MRKAFLNRGNFVPAFIILFIFCCTQAFSSQSENTLTPNKVVSKNGTLTEDEIWYADSTYYISDNVILADGVELKIEPGTVIKFENDKYINAQNGKLIAKGAPYEYIVFTSKYDSYMGEIIDSSCSPSRGCWTGLYLSDDDVVSFCKISYADIALDVLWNSQVSGKIENNIIYNFAFAGISCLIDNDANGTCRIKNNLIFNDSSPATFGIYFICDNILNANLVISNNTISKNSFGVHYTSSGLCQINFQIINNLFTDCTSDSIYLEGVDCQILNNGFFNASAVGTDYIQCSANPFDADETSLCSYFLNKDNDGGKLLLNTGLGDVADFYDTPTEWSIHNVPDDGKHFFYSKTILTSDKIWLPDYSTCDTGNVAIGYHHPRVDYCVKERVSLADGKTLEIEPGTVISMDKDLGSASSQIKCTGELKQNIYFINQQYASANRLQASSSNSFQSSYSGNYEFIKFLGLMNCQLPEANSINNCTFKFLTNGLYTNNSLVNNNIFSECKIGIWLGINTELKNNTFDRCHSACSIYYINGGDNSFVTNNLFINNFYAINENESTPMAMVENYNAFIGNEYEHIYYDYLQDLSLSISLGQSSLSDKEQGSPCCLYEEYEMYLGWQEFSDRFYLSPYSLLIDSGAADDEPMLGYTSDPYGYSIDDDTRNIGYHYPVQKEYWLKAGSPDSGDGSEGNPFNSIGQIQDNNFSTWDIVHIITEDESDSNLALLFEEKDWPDRQYQTSEIYRNGIRWTFDKEYRIGQFCNGDFWVISNPSVQIISVSPSPLGSGEDFRNGSMLNPIGNIYHAYDGRVDGFSDDYLIEYPLTLEGENSLISSASIIAQPNDCLYGYLDTSNYCVRYNYEGDFHSYLYSAAALTTVSYVQPSDIFRPPYAGAEKPFISKKSLQTSLLPFLPLSTRPSLSYLNWVSKEFQNVWIDHKNNSTVRLLHPVKNMPNYGREIGIAVSEASCLLTLDYTSEQLNPLLINFVQTGIDLYYACINGTYWGGEGGHDNGRKLPIVLTGILLNNDEMKNVTQNYNQLGCEDLQTYYNDANKALWGRNCVSSYTLVCDGNGAKDCRDPNQLIDGCQDYRNCCTSNTWVGQAVALKILGAEDIWLHDAFFDYVRRWITADVPGGGEISGGSYIRDMWNTFWPAGITIIDNGQTGSMSSTGTWAFSSAPNPYSTGSLWSANGATYTWTFKPLETGKYKVSMWWTAVSTRSDAVPLTIQHSAGTASTTINQQLNGGQWNDIGEFTMVAENSYNVKITAPDGSPPSTCADAVKFTYMNAANAPPIASIISIAPNPALCGETVSFAGSGVDTDGTIIEYKWQSDIDGVLNADSSFDTNSLSQGNHQITFAVKDNDEEWSLPATKYITVGQPTSDVIIDNGDPATSHTGTWCVSSAANPYDTNSLWSYSGAKYIWIFTPAQSGTYKVSMWWTQLDTRSLSVPVTIENTGGTATVTINQQQNGGQWNELGQYAMDANTVYRVTITAPTGSPPSTCADAVRFELVSLVQYQAAATTASTTATTSQSQKRKQKKAH